MNILIIGNGATEVNEHGNSVINIHTADFLHELSLYNHNISFAQPFIKHDINANIRGYEIRDDNIKTINFEDSKKSLFKNISLLIKNIFMNDFIYIFYPGSFPRIAILLSVLLRKNYGLYIRGEKFQYNGFTKYLFNKSNFIITVSTLIKKQISKHNKYVSVIRPMNKLTHNYSYIRDPLEDIKKELEFLFVGRVEYRKGIYDLLKVSEYLDNLGVNHKLRIVGAGPLSKKIELDKNNGIISNNIILEGHVGNYSQLMDYYKNADFFIFLSHDEGFPRVLYEAMIKSLPIYTTFVGGIPGRMIDGVNCVKVPVKNPIETANIIFKSLKDINELHSIGLNGHDTTIEVLQQDDKHEAVLNRYLNYIS